jgi:hypothetical protein
LLPALAAADVVIVQATTVGAQAHASGKQVLALAFSPLVQRSGMDYAALGMGVPVPHLDALPALLDAALTTARRGTHSVQGDAAQRVAREIEALAHHSPKGSRA